MVFFPIATAAVSCLALHLQHQRNFYSSYSLKNKSYQSNQPQSYSGRVPPTAILNSNIGRRRRTTGKQLQMTQDEQQQLSQRKTMRSMPLVPSSRSPAEAQLQIQDYTREMNQRHQQPTVFTDEEVEGVVHSLQNVVPPGFASLSSKNSSNAVLPDLLRKVAHLSHKDWSVTDQNAIALSQALSLSSLENAAASMEQNVDPAAAVRLMLERILRDGNWKGAAAARAEASSKGGDSAQGQHQQQQPWVVLVTVRTLCTQLCNRFVCFFRLRVEPRFKGILMYYFPPSAVFHIGDLGCKVRTTLQRSCLFSTSLVAHISLSLNNFFFLFSQWHSENNQYLPNVVSGFVARCAGRST